MDSDRIEFLRLVNEAEKKQLEALDHFNITMQKIDCFTLNPYIDCHFLHGSAQLDLISRQLIMDIQTEITVCGYTIINEMFKHIIPLDAEDFFDNLMDVWATDLYISVMQQNKTIEILSSMAKKYKNIDHITNLVSTPYLDDDHPLSIFYTIKIFNEVFEEDDDAEIAELYAEEKYNLLYNDSFTLGTQYIRKYEQNGNILYVFTNPNGETTYLAIRSSNLTFIVGDKKEKLISAIKK